MDFMKLLLKLLISGLVLLTTAFAQEPKHAVVAQEPVAQSRILSERVIMATGSPQRSAPLVQPKALPPMNPSLGEIARQARAAHTAVPKAQIVTAEATPQK
jgi:hypothetical protein